MTSDEYAQILDDFELNAPGDVMPGESLTEYIERRRREFESKADGGRIGFDLGGFERVKKLAKDLFGKEVKDLNDDELESIREYLSESKADGGMIGIEVLFGPKRDEYQTGGRIGFNMGGAQFTSGGNISPGTDKRGNVRDDNPFTGGGGGDGPPSIINPPPVIKPPVVTDNFNDRGFLSDVRIKNQKKYLDILSKYKPSDFNTRNIIDGTSNLTEEEINFMDRYGVGKIFNDLSKQNIENFMDIREGIAPKINPSEITSPREYEFAEVTDIDLKRAKEPMTKMMDYDTYKSVNPSSKITPYEFEELKKGNITETGTFTAADGGRVGLFMGGPALEGQALAIYNSMNVTGATDQEIADRLQSLGLYTPGATTTPPPTTPSQPSGYIGRDDNDGPSIVDMTDYSFNKKNYAPGEKLEVNPAAFGISFEKASKPQGIINAALDMPGRTLTSFASPTTGGNITGPAEEGFMSQVVDIDPAGRTREELRQLYDNYNRFFGAPSNFAAARTPGKAGQVFGTIVGAAAGIPFLGPGIDALSKLGSGGDKSLQTKYGVEGGFGGGNTKFRDEFGVSVVDDNKRIFGKKDRDYLDRMEERLGQLEGFFGSRIEGFDINNLTPDMLTDMRRINSFYTKQVQAYLDRIEVEKINEAQKQKEEADALQARIDAERAAGAAANQAMQRREGRGGDHMSRSRAQGGLGISKSQAQAISDANRKAGMGGYGLKDGGLATMFTRRR